MTEPFAVPDVFASGIGSVEELSPGLFRVTLYARQRCLFDINQSDCLVVSRLVVTAETMSAFASLANMTTLEDRSAPSMRHCN